MQISAFTILLIVVDIILTVFIINRANAPLLTLSTGALLAGIAFESSRIIKDPKYIINLFLAVYFFSGLSLFLKGDDLDASVIKFWPFIFIFGLFLYLSIEYEKRLIARLTEGTTLLLSLSLIYWMIDYGFEITYGWKSVIILSFISLFTLFSIVNAVTGIQLSNIIRLLMSLWSSLIMVAFSVDYMFRVFSNGEIETQEYLSDKILTGLDNFLLGISAIYIIKNFFLLLEFLPAKNESYWKDIRELKAKHIERYSDEQVTTANALVCILFAGSLFSLNYYYQFLPRQTMIWLVFWSFPLLLAGYRGLVGSKRTGRPSY